MRRTKVGLAAVPAMALMMATAVPAFDDRLDLGPVLCSDYTTGIPESPPLCAVDGGIDISYLVPLGG
jgi:hypothetical protein